MVPKTWPSTFPDPKFKREINNPIVFYTCFSFFCIIFSFWSTLFCILFVNTFHIAHLNFPFISIDLSLLTLSILLYSIRRSQWTVSWKVSVIWSRNNIRKISTWLILVMRMNSRKHGIMSILEIWRVITKSPRVVMQHLVMKVGRRLSVSILLGVITSVGTFTSIKATLKQNVNLRFPQKDVRAIDFITICIQNIEVIDEIGHSSW